MEPRLSAVHVWGPRKNYCVLYRQILKVYNDAGAWVWGAVKASACVGNHSISTATPACRSRSSHSRRSFSISSQHLLPFSVKRSWLSLVRSVAYGSLPFLFYSPILPPQPHPVTSVRSTRSRPQTSVALPHLPTPSFASMLSSVL